MRDAAGQLHAPCHAQRRRLRAKLRLLDFFGREAEEETVTLREIEILEIDTQEEKMYAVLEELERQRMTLLPRQDTQGEP